jgi:subtilisin
MKLGFGRAVAATVLLGAILMVGSSAAQSGPAGTYVVVLKPGVASVPAAAASIGRAHGGTVGFVYEHALRGFSVRVSEQGAAGIARNPMVAYVEADQLFEVAAQTVPTGIRRIFAPGNPNIDIDGIDDKRVNVDVAVIDTGIDLDHPDLNVVGSTNCASGGPNSKTCGAGGDDGNGHGTHVGGTIGALDNGLGVVGVAPGARLWAVKVLGNNGSGYTSWIVAGMDWVTARAATIEVANMSLGGGISQAIDDAANRMADAGVALAVSAGNSNANASGFSPARAQKVLTVSALADFNGLPGGGAAPTCRTDQDDTLADFSNWGSTIELAAPGVCILSTWLNGGYNTISGTSMASPHAAGALALLASRGFSRTWTGVSGLYSTLQSTGNLNWTDDSGDGIKERLLDVSNTTVFNPVLTDGPGGGDPPPNQPPTASFTASCSGLTCTFDGSASSDPDGSIVSHAWTFGDSTGGSGQVVGKTYAAGGTYTVTLTVTDNSGATGGTSRSVTVSAAATGTNVALAGSSTNNGSTWTANVAVTVTHDGSPASGTTVAGTWSNGTTGAGTCTTNASGQCTISKPGIPKSTGSVRFTVDTVGGSTSFGGTAAITVSK